MSIAITQVNAAADTFSIWLSRTNAVINAMSTAVLTANGSANGDITTGNAYVNGVFSAVVIATPTLRGGNVQSIGVMNVVSNVFITNSSMLTIGNTTVNATANSTTLTISTANVQTINSVSGNFSGSLSIGNSAFVPISNTVVVNTTSVVDTFLLSTNTRSAEYNLTLKDNNSNAYQVSKLLLIQDGGTVQLTEFAILATNGSIGVFSSSINSTAVALSFRPNTSNNATIKGWRGVTIL